MMKKKLNKRILSAILAFVTFLSCCPIVSLASDGFMITHEGKAVTQISVDKYKKVEVCAENIPEGIHQWQIKVPGADLWVNIHGQTGQELGLSYALLGSLLDGDSAYVRCAAISGGEEVAYTAELRATITEETVEKPTEAVVIKPVEVPTAAPVENPTEVATEAPTEVATEAPTEAATEAPTEAATEAPTEVATEAPTEAATEAPTEVATEAPTEVATEAPTEVATEAPTEVATEAPTEVATEAPTEGATEAPTEVATEVPTEVPATEAPTEVATEAPTEVATEAPTEVATEAPTEAATEAPTEVATEASTEVATEAPTEVATEAPTEAATEAPTEAATEAPTEVATEAPTEAVTEEPTEVAAEPATEEPVAAPLIAMFSMARSTDETEATEDPIDNQAETEEINLVSITIQYTYVDKDGSPVEGFDWPPYVANIQSGEPYNKDIQIKEIPGYTAKLKENYDGVTLSDDKKTITLKLDKVETSVTYVVAYELTKVQYHVRRFLQNVNNDLYTEAKAFVGEEFWGFPGGTPDTAAIYRESDYPGFTALFYQPDTIAADGSTVFEIYYDRNYYLINFDLDGGYGVKPIYARYGTNISISDPEKPGYSFGGWKLIKEGNTEVTDSAVEMNLTGTVPAYNQTYQAQWTDQTAEYAVAYWIVDSQGNRTYIGSDIRTATSGDVIDGKDDLITMLLCDHTHNADCYDRYSSQGTPSDLEMDAMRTLENGEPEAGYVYTVDYTDRTYYMLRGDDYWNCWPKDDGTLDSIITSSVIKQITYTDENGTEYAVRKYHANFDCGHAHTDECSRRPYLEYVTEMRITKDDGTTETISADQDVVVKGDGSTVVNVYYQYRKYRLKFYYAAAEGDTTNATNVTYKVIGGSTYFFGGQHQTGASYNNFINSSTFDMLNRVFTAGVYGQVASTSTPSLKQSVINAGIYDTGCDYDSTHDRTYYYISFTARYNDNIASKWPADVFNSITMASGHYNSSFGSTATVSAWNGEHHVWYSRHNDNETIKGVYELLDSKILYDSELYTTYPESENSQGTDPLPTVSYLCFWQNGAAISWSIPELYIYNIWLPYTGDSFDTLPEDEKKVFDGKNYYLHDSYNVCDDSLISKQTVPSLTGYTYNEKDKESNWGVIFISNATNPSGSTYKGPGDKDGSRITYDSSTHTATDASGWASDQQTLTITTQDDGRYLLQSSDYETKYKSNTLNETVYREAYYRDFFYTANIHKLNFWNRNDWLNSGDGVVGGVAYGASLKKYFEGVTVGDKKYDGANDIVQYPDKYPTGLEPNAYYFEGWYTTADCLEGTEVDWENMTMPDADLTVYAHWAPKTYDVTFYLDYEEYLAETPKYYEVTGTSHGEIMKDLDNDKVVPSKDGYDFVRWVYEDAAGNKRSFDPTQMPVQQDMELYAEWRSTEISEFTVYYVLGEENEDGTIVAKLDDEGKKTYLTAAPVTGYAVVGTTKTVQAKTADALDHLPETQEDWVWFPNTSSHSILIKEDKNVNVFEFLYIAKNEDVQYTVHYLDAQSGQPVYNAEKMTTRAAEETVWFRYVEGYVPDAVNKRLVLSADESQNVVIFYYTKEDPGQAAYQVNHWLMGTDGSSFPVEDCISEVFTGTIGTEVTGEVRSIEGFAYVEQITAGGETYQSNQKGTVTSGADNDANKPLVLNLYYRREEKTYTVYYRDRDNATYNVLTPTSKTALYGTYVTEFAEDAEHLGYELISDTEQSLTISSSDNLNQLTFLYKKKDVSIQYIAKCSDPHAVDFGILSSSSDYGTQPGGSTAYAKSGFYFDGWYSDESCNDLVTKNATLDPNDRIQTGVYEYTFYALFKPYTLTISQKNMNAGDSAVYEVVNSSNAVIARVMLTGEDDSVMLVQVPAGTYTVREITQNWTWTYDNPDVSHANGQITVLAGQDNEITFNYAEKHTDSCWRHGEDRK